MNIHVDIPKECVNCQSEGEIQVGDLWGGGRKKGEIFLGTTQKGKEEYARIKAKVGRGNSYKSDLLFDNWDKLYGDGHLSYEVYMGTDPSKPDLIKFGKYLEFNHQPFYVGYGTYNHRSQESLKCKRNKYHYCHKTKRLEAIEAAGCGESRRIIIGYFQTQAKAMLVERKVMNVRGVWNFLTNVTRHLCELPLTRYDCNVIYNKNRIVLPLTMASHGKRPK